MTPADFQHKLDEARQLLLAHEFGRALAQYEKLTRQWPGEAVLWAEYGNAASGAGQFDLADRTWQQALGLAPGNAELIGMIGHQYQGMRQPEKALGLLRPGRGGGPASHQPTHQPGCAVRKEPPPGRGARRGGGVPGH